MAILFQPLTLQSLTIKNRIVVSPMCQYNSLDGFANPWHLVHLGTRASGGAGIVCTEATAVSPEGRITPDDLGIWKEPHIAFLKEIAGFIKQQGAVPAMQLAHAGRKASHHAPWKGGRYLSPSEGGWTTLGPSPVPFRIDEPASREMMERDIEKLIDDFKQAAARARKAGFEIIEVHAAHGYLLHAFLSPLSNQRTDRYGGSFENRIRLLLQVIAAVREVWPPALPLFVRISASDWTEGGWTLEDSVALAGKLKAAGVDLVDCSSGGNVPRADIPVTPGYQVPFAARVRKEAGIATGAVGLITGAAQAEAILQQGSRHDFPGASIITRSIFSSACSAGTGRRTGLAGSIRAGKDVMTTGRFPQKFIILGYKHHI